MTRRQLILCGVLLLAAFFVLNASAYRGYFSDDDLDNLAWTRDEPVWHLLQGLITPQLFTNNFRPVGHAVYKVMALSAGLEFPWYIVLIHALHLANAILLWRLVRRLEVGSWAAAFGLWFFVIHFAAFDAYWKPMYLFDVFCTLFVLLSLLLYLRGRWLLALIPFWLAYKSKELAVMLPFVLIAYELFLGGRRWRRVLPYLAVSLMFVAQAFVANRGRVDDYSLRFTGQAFWTCLEYYSSQIFLVPFAGLALLPLVLFVRKPVFRFGIFSACFFAVPLLFLPGRLFSVYLYLPVALVAVALSALLPERLTRSVLVSAAAVAIVWLLVNTWFWKPRRRHTLNLAAENRGYVESIESFAERYPKWQTFVLDGMPAGLNLWGARGAFRWYFPDPATQVVWTEDEQDVQQTFELPLFAVASWDRQAQHLTFLIHRPTTPDLSFLQAGVEAPLWQLTAGWFLPEARFRWMKPTGLARLRYPSGADRFEVTANISELQLSDQRRIRIEPVLNGVSLGPQWFDRTGFLTASWPVPPNLPSRINLELRADPFRPSNGDPRTLGLAVVSFGFRGPGAGSR